MDGPGLGFRGALTKLQGQVRDLVRQLEKQPKYFDDPLDSKLRP